MFIVLFAIPRMSGRLAQWLELIHDKSEGVTGILRDAGFDVEPTPTIRREIWYELWGNVTGNPISALAGAHAALPRVNRPGLRPRMLSGLSVRGASAGFPDQGSDERGDCSGDW